MVAVMCLVVQHHDLAFRAPERAQDASRDHLGSLLERVGILRLSAAEQLSRVRRHTLDLLRVAGQEGVVIDDMRPGRAAARPTGPAARDRARGSTYSSRSGCRTPSRSRIVMPGVTTRKRFAKRASVGVITLLIVCQAMSIRHHDGLARCPSPS